MAGIAVLILGSAMKDEYSRISTIMQNYLFVIDENFSPDERDYDPVIHQKLGLYLNKMTSPNDRIQLWATDALAYFYANRPFSSKQTNPTILWLSIGHMKKKLYGVFERYNKNTAKVFCYRKNEGNR